MKVSTVGLDLAKSVFHLHALTAAGEVAVDRPLRRAQLLGFFARLEPCLVGMEACGTSHFWAREIARLGHEVRLIPPAYVKPYVKRGKSDAADAAAICEAVARPTMRFVPVKPPEQQAMLALHRVRDQAVRQRTQSINLLRGLLAEFGIALARGAGHALAFARSGAEAGAELPRVARVVVAELCATLLAQHRRVEQYDAELVRAAKDDPAVALLQTIPGVGLVTASALAATVGDARRFESGRDLAAWIGLTPLNRSTGGKQRLGSISRMGDRTLRRLLVVGTASRVRQIRNRPEAHDPWSVALLGRKPARLAAVAMANKTARIAWAVLARGEPYRPNGRLTAGPEKETPRRIGRAA
jgi:transposase